MTALTILGAAFVLLTVVTFFDLKFQANRNEKLLKSLLKKLEANEWEGSVYSVNGVVDKEWANKTRDALSTFCDEFNALCEMLGYQHVRVGAIPERYEFVKMKKSKKR